MMSSTNGTNDKYALALAALAEAAAAKNNASANPALDAATDLTTGVSATNKTTLGLSSADLQAGVQAAQATYGDSNVQNLDLSSAIPTPATLPQPAAGVTWSDLDKAKHLFSDLRSDALTLVNDQKTGFFQVEGKAMADDMKASVKGHGAHFVDSDMAIMAGAQLSAMAVSGNLSGTTQWVDYQNVMHYDLNGCEVVGNSTTATCNVWVDYTYDPVTYSSTQTTIEIDVSPSSAASGSFTYTAQEKQDTYTNGSSAETLVGAATTGTITVSGTGSNGSVVINGNLPVADSTTQSAVLKNVTLSSSTNSSNQNTRALSGSYVYSENGTPVVTFSVLSGSQATVQVSTDANGNTYTEGVSGSLSLELKTAKFQYDGALNVGNFQKDKSGMDREPTHMDFAGTITDLNPDVGVVYTGKLALDATNFSAYDITQPTSSTNFQAGTVSYVGQVNPINRPPLKLTFSASQTTWDKVNMEVDYAYGDDHLTGTTVLTVNPNGPGAYDQTITITNSNNVKLVLTKPANGGTLTGTITVGGNTATIATISGDQVNYTDGTFEAII